MQRQIFIMVANFIAIYGLIIQPCKAHTYDANLIPDSMKTNANAVIREEIMEYLYITSQNNVLKIKQVITVLNKNGDNQAILEIGYDKFRKVNIINANIYKADGEPYRKIKTSEIKDNSGSVGYDLYSDSRYKYFAPMVSEYPYTVEYEYQINYSGSYYFPDWLAFHGYNVSIEKSEFKIQVIKNYQINYKEYNFNNSPDITHEELTDTYIWKAENIKAVDNEPFSDEIFRYVKAVFTAPSEYTLAGYTGNMNSWKDFGLWFQKLNAGRDQLPQERVDELRTLISNISDDREKVKVLYKYLQQRTRYFFVAFGIGGLQPFEAATLDKVGYGDCKGLTNYMKALLNAAGITSFYTLVKSGDNFPQLISDFPSHQFDHVILCVPLKNDTIWLECTSQISPFGFLGYFTSDRQVLLIKDDGGEIARTPVYSLEQNYQITYTTVNLSIEGNAVANITRKFGGLQFDNFHGELQLGAEDQKRWLYNYLKIPNYKIDKYNFRQENKDLPESILNISITANGYGSSSDKRIFLPLNMVNQSEYIPKKLKQRWGNIEKKISYIDIDSVTYNLPGGIDIEFLPEKKELKSRFGEYISLASVKDDKITYVRQIKMFKGNFPKETYEELIKFYREINLSDNSQAVLVKKGN
jgi:transglutaminase-like putative cysteine protease